MQNMMIKQMMMALTTSVSLLAFVAQAQAGPFEESLKNTYQHNPRLQAQREALKATDELISRAISGWRPTVTGTYERGRATTSFDGSADSTNNTELRQLDASQPIFNGGRNFAAYSAAKNRIEAGRAQLRTVEQSVLLEAIAAYMDVVRDQSILDLSRNNENVLTEQLKASQERFDVGEVTRTDVAQSEARLSRAKSDTISAEGNLVSSRANFVRVVGFAPENILPVPESVSTLPVSLEEAIEIALAHSSQMETAHYQYEAADDDIWVNGSDLLPKVSLRGRMSRDEGAGVTGGSKFDTDEWLVNVTVPLYQAGAEYSRVREAKKRAKEAQFQRDDAHDEVVEQVTKAWEDLQTSVATIASRKEQIRAAEVALEGVREEQQYGSRTVLDVLDAEQELFQARVNLVAAQRTRIVSIYNLMAVVGRLTAQDLALDLSYYDPEENYRSVKWQFIGF